MSSSRILKQHGWWAISLPALPSFQNNTVILKHFFRTYTVILKYLCRLPFSEYTAILKYLQIIFQLSRRNGTNSLLVGEMGVGEMGVGEVAPIRVPFLRTVLPPEVGESARAMAATARQKHSYLHHQGEFQHQNCTVGSLHESDDDDVFRIFVGHS